MKAGATTKMSSNELSLDIAYGIPYVIGGGEHDDDLRHRRSS